MNTTLSNQIGLAAMSSFTLSALVAYAKHRVIGHRNTLPWHLPADLKRFKALTMGKPIIMGRQTHLAIGRALPGRTNIILSRNADFAPADCIVMHTLPNAIDYAAQLADQAFIIGGAEVYEHALPFINCLYITEIYAEFNGDAYFPELDANDWKEESREIHQQDEANAYSYAYITLKRIESK